MSAILEQEEIHVTDWHGCYGEKWGADLVPAAVKHPAKYSRALIRRIYEHAFAEGWLRAGSRVVDPFGGIAGGALEAMLRGCHWEGRELESKFVALGNQNIALWNERYSRMPMWGTARLVQGDSRKLSEVVTGAELVVSSPPYVKPPGHGGKSGRFDIIAAEKSLHRPDYGDTAGQLAIMPEGSFDLAISSPPFNENKNNQIHGSTKGVYGGTPKERLKKDYLAPEDPANVGALPITNEGYDLAISSPPYAEARIPQTGGSNEDNMRRSNDRNRYADSTVGQLGAMKPGDFDVAISSPPYEGNYKSDRTQEARDERRGFRQGKGCFRASETYGKSEGQLGASSGEDFWSASRLILEQLHQVLAPGGHAIFVTKNFVRNKRIVPFSQQWARLGEAVGFRLVCAHRAMLVEHHGTQGGMFGEDAIIQTERKSFFRRLAEQKGSPRVDWEDVMCFEKVD